MANKFNDVNPRENFPQMEDRILEFWKKRKIFEKSVDQRSEKDKYVFYDGPPFITGTPHYGTLLSRIAKDVVPRYWTMNGKRIERQWGWDCHGLPIENKVEAKLELKNRRDIEKIGILKFIESCYEYTEQTSADWEWYKDKIGQWVDFENAYKTMSQDSMESVMWVFSELHKKNLVYEGVRVSLYCTRCGTPISNFEIAMDNSYEIMNDPAVTIKFPVKGEPNTYLLAWTTTPWTLPSNRALVVDTASDYVKIKRKVEVKKSKTVRGLLLNGDKVALIKYGRDHSYSLPGGKINEGEKPEDAVLREFLEETGYQNLKVSRKLGNLKHQFLSKVNTIIDQDCDVFLLEFVDKNRVSPKFDEEEKNYHKMSFEWVDSEIAAELLSGNGYDQQFLDQIEKSGEIEVKGSKVADESFEEFLILAKPRLNEVFKTYKDQIGDYEIVEEFKGEKLLGTEYEPLFDFFPPNDKDFKVYAYEGMVTMDDGTGIVHSAPGFGDIDTEMGKETGLTMMFSVNEEGKFVKAVTDFSGMYIKKADPFIIKNLTERNRVFRSERIDHRYPYCYRCHTPLIHKAQNSWYIDIQKIKNDMIAQNENVNWVPDHIKNGRFKKGLEAAPDWGISRTRYWATPMPVWREKGDSSDHADHSKLETIVISSRDELRNLSQEPITKLVLINNADFEKSENGPLTDNGWEQARELEKKFGDKVDVVAYGQLEKTKQTVEPILDGNKRQVEVISSPVFGSAEMEREFKELEAELLKNNEAELLSDLSEEVLEGAFDKYQEALKTELGRIINENEGKLILISTTDYLLPLVRNAFQKIKRRVAYRTNPLQGSFREIYLDGLNELDLHRPFIDKFTLKSESGKVLHRIPEVLDVWLDSGSMPYAMKHYPFEDKKDFEANFPADFVVEYIAQTRAWFYVMHVLSTALMGTNSFKNVVTTGVMAGTDGRKMSKSYGNYPDPKETILKYGADPLRLYLMGSKIMVAEDISFSEEAIKDQIKTLLLPLWNSYSFFVTYANKHGFEPGPELVQNATDSENWKDIPFEPKDKLNIWIIFKLQMTILNIKSAFEEYNIPRAVKEFPEFMADLSKWFIRRSREKFNAGDEESMKTLYYVLVEYTKLLAPLAPFITEELYKNLVVVNIENARESVHLTDYPAVDDDFMQKHEKDIAKMDLVKNIVNLGQSLRVENNLKVRQPLSEIEVKYDMDPARDTELEGWMKDLISEELNVKKVEEDRNLDSYEGWVKAEDEKWGLKVSLNTKITEDLKIEGIIRELQRGIQSERKKTGFKFEDTVNVQLISENELLKKILKDNLDKLKTFVKANAINLVTQSPERKVIRIDDDNVDILITKS